MLGSFLFSFTLFAAKAASAPAKRGDDGSMSTMMWLFPLVGLAFYFLILRPGNNTEKSRRERLSKVKKNDKVWTSAGIYGTVVQVDPEGKKVVVRVDDERGVRLTFRLESIVEVTDPSAEKEKGEQREKDKAIEAV